MAGYSGTPLVRKLGIKADHTILLIDAPSRYDEWVAPLPAGVHRTSDPGREVDLYHVFATDRDELQTILDKLRVAMRPDAVVWVSWPKKASGVPSSITEDVIREVALPMGFVDVKVCAVDATWSGLKLVVRKENR